MPPDGAPFRNAGPGDTRSVGNWRTLRCETCGGSLYIDEIEEVQIHKELSAEQLFGPEPRKGRPRKRESRQSSR
jgi:hypothetical protein